MIAIGFLIGAVGTMLAALPALLRASRLTVAEGLAGGLAVTSGWGLERLLCRIKLPLITQAGLRNITRRKARTFGTVVQVGIATGVAIAFLAVGSTIATETVRNWDIQHWDVVATQRSNVALDAEAQELIATTDGYGIGHPVLYNTVEIDGSQYEAWGVPPNTTLFEPDIQSGRWFEPGVRTDAVAVIGPGLANSAGIAAGDRTTFETAAGPYEFHIIGVDGRIINGGQTP